MGSGRIRDKEPKLVDAASRGRLRAQAVGSDLVSLAGKPDRPDRALFTIAHDGDDRHARKIGRLPRDNCRYQKRQRKCSKNRRCPAPEENAVPQPWAEAHRPAFALTGDTRTRST